MVFLDVKSLLIQLTLCYSVLPAHMDCIRVLLRFGARTDIKDLTDRSPSQLANCNQQFEAIHSILEAHGAEIEPYRDIDTTLPNTDMPLWVAAKRGNVSLVASAIKAAKMSSVVDLDALDPLELKSPLQYAAEEGHTRIFKMLLEAGADTVREDRSGSSAARRAIEFGHMRALRAILAYQVDINALDSHGRSLLAYAHELENWKMAVLLIHRGANLSSVAGFSDELLCFAAGMGCSEVSLKLIKAGAEPQIKTKNGLTSFQLAKKFGHHKTAKIILDCLRSGGERPTSSFDEDRFSIPSESEDSEEEGSDDQDEDRFSIPSEGEDSEEEDQMIKM